jgi:phosphatidylinositol glycan class B
LKNYIRRIKQSKKLQLILFSGLIIQLIFCFTSVGYFHPDQHFQIIEFSSFQLKEANATKDIWELSSNIRPTLQVYLFSAFKLFCFAISIENPFYQLTILRFLQGVTFFIAFNMIAFYVCNTKPERTLIITILLLNFSWFLPYSRTLFSSEMVSALVFFPALAFFHHCYLSNKTHLYNSVFTGFLLAASFFLRFQIAFAITGFAIWILVFEKQFKISIYLLIGFVIGTATNIFLDYNFYHKLAFTPYLYFKVNILDGVAASFGEKNFVFYIGVLSAIVGAPLISIFLLYNYVKTCIQQFNHPLILSTLIFILGHFIIGHKEDRFMFTIICMIPMLLALNDNAYDFLSTSYKWKKIIIPILVFSTGLNFILLILFIFNPYSQTIHFEDILSSKISSEQTKVYCYQRTPLETESHLPLVYYRKGFKNIEFITIHNIDSVMHLLSKPLLLASTFNDIKDKFGMIESLGYKPQHYSSLMLWNLNMFLRRKNVNTINDIWILYKLEK